MATAPAAAQGGQRYSSSPQSSENPYEGRGLFGGLFGREERPRREREPEGYQQAQASAADMTMRLDRLENAIRQLTGLVEELQHRNQQLEQRLRAQDGQDAGGARPVGGQPPRRVPPSAQQGQQPPAPAATAPTQRRSDVFDPNENPGAPGVPQPLGSVPPRTASAVPLPSAQNDPQDGEDNAGSGGPLDLATLADRASGGAQIDPPGSPPPQAVPSPAREPRNIAGPLPPPPPRNTSGTGGAATTPGTQRVASAPTATPRDELALGQGFVQRRDYAAAEESLREFLKKYPSDRLVPEAHYWLGESLFHRQRFRDAAESYLTVSTKYERSGKAADSLLRLGQSLAALGEREAACATLNEVGRKYPKASAGMKQTVEREQKRARC